MRLAFETKRDSRSSLRRICSTIYHEHPPIVRHIGSSIVNEGVAAPSSGLVNFYRGFSSTLAGMLPYAGMSFLTHDVATDLLRSPAVAPYSTTTLSSGQDSDRLPVLKYWAELLAGGSAGLVSQTTAYPFEIIRRRMQVGGAVGDGHMLGMAETAKRVWLERGWRGFFVGLGIGYFKVVPMVAVSFFTYERMKVVLGV